MDKIKDWDNYADQKIKLRTTWVDSSLTEIKYDQDSEIYWTLGKSKRHLEDARTGEVWKSWT